MRCYCRVNNYGCMARYQLRVGRDLSLSHSAGFRKIKNARFGGFCFDASRPTTVAACLADYAIAVGKFGPSLDKRKTGRRSSCGHVPTLGRLRSETRLAERTAVRVCGLGRAAERCDSRLLVVATKLSAPAPAVSVAWLVIAGRNRRSSPRLARVCGRLLEPGPRRQSLAASVPLTVQRSQ